MQPQTKSSLSLSRVWLIELLQRLDIGVIKVLIIRDGEPVFDPPSRVVRCVKPGANNGSHSESDIVDYAVKAWVRNLLARLDDLGNKTILCLKIQYGPSVGTQLEKYSLEQRGAVSLLDRSQNITSPSTGHK